MHFVATIPRNFMHFVAWFRTGSTGGSCVVICRHPFQASRYCLAPVLWAPWVHKTGSSLHALSGFPSLFTPVRAYSNGFLIHSMIVESSDSGPEKSIHLRWGWPICGAKPMLKFPAVPAYHHDLRIVRADDSLFDGGRCLHPLPPSKIGFPDNLRRGQKVVAADSGNSGKGFSVQFADRGRVFAQHVLPILKWKWNRSENQKLPIYFYRDGQQLQYVWDGHSLFMECVDPKVTDGVSIREPKIYRLGSRRILRALKKTFVPENAMLQAIGIGARRALPAAAGLNWVLKDGLGRLGRLAYSGALGSTFDSNLKRVRFSTSVLFSLSLGLEISTPYFPNYFLFLATVANVGRSIALAAYLATSSAIHKSFAIGDNLADIAAKGQVQTVVADNLGLALSCALSTLLRSDRRLEPLLLFFIFPVLAGVDLFAIYHMLQAVHLQTLNKVRLEFIVEKWLRNRKVPSTEEVSTLEGLQFFQFPGQQSLPLRIGALNPVGWTPDSVLHEFQAQSQQPYAVFRESYSPLPFFYRSGLLLWLRDGFSPKDVITAALQVGHLRAIASSESFSSSSEKFGDKETVDFIDRQESTKGRETPKNLQKRWRILLARSRYQALEDVDSLLAAMEASGWQTKNVLLAPKERHTYFTELKEKG